MNNFSIENPKLFCKIFETIKLFSSHINFNISSNTFHIQSIDDAHISIIDIVFNKNYFHTYNIEDDNIKITLDILDLCKIFKIINKSNFVYFNINNNTNTLDIIVNYDNNLNKKFKINLIMNTYSFTNISNNNNNNENDLIFELNKDILSNIFNELYTFSDNLNISYKYQQKTLKFTNNDSKTNLYSNYKLSNIFNKYNNNIDIDINVSLLYLNKFKLLQNISNPNIKLILNQNKPIHINLLDDNININFLLAPKINDDY